MNRPKSAYETRQAQPGTAIRTNAFLSAKQTLRVICACLAVALLMNTFAFAAEGLPTCGKAEHAHTEDCYAPILVCGEDAREPVTETVRRFTANFTPHKHTKDCLDDDGNYVCGFVEGEYTHVHNRYCYDADGRRVCGLEERKPHKHTDACYAERVELTCGLEESAGHVHTDACKTVETRPICGLEENKGHVHTAACYTEEDELTCGKAESAGHVHGDACYAVRSVLSCGREESAGHVHGDACYTVRSVLSCGREESAGHVHGSGCYTRTLTCGQEEGEAHAHSDGCYSNVLTCGKSEGEGAHTHSDACYEQVRELTCGKIEGEGAHTHSEACYDQVRELVCGKAEGEDAHTHSETCYTHTKKLTCGKSEGEGAHTHGEACYSKETVITCGIAEGDGAHSHTDACYTRVRELVCGEDMSEKAAKQLKLEHVEMHTHKASCFATVRKDDHDVQVAVCGKWEVPAFESSADSWTEETIVVDEGHTHTEACYQPSVGPTCGIETHEHDAGCYGDGAVNANSGANEGQKQTEISMADANDNVNDENETEVGNDLPTDGTADSEETDASLNGDGDTANPDDNENTDETVNSDGEENSDGDESIEEVENPDDGENPGGDENPSEIENPDDGENPDGNENPGEDENPRGEDEPLLEEGEESDEVEESETLEWTALPAVEVGGATIELSGEMPVGASAWAEAAEVPGVNGEDLLACASIAILDAEGSAYVPESGESFRIIVRSESIREAIEGGYAIEVRRWSEDGLTSETIVPETISGDAVAFTAELPAVFTVERKLVKTTLVASDGSAYEVTVTYDNTARIPDGAALRVREVGEATLAYERYLNQALEALEASEESLRFAKVLDICLENPATGVRYSPEAAVDVSIQLLNESVDAEAETGVVHFGSETEVLDTEIEGETIAFSTEGFSVYVIEQHEGGEVITPRVEFHFIDGGLTQSGDGLNYSDKPYKFVNKANEEQTTQIVKDGEALEKIINPPNKFENTDDASGNIVNMFYAWAIVDLKSDNGSSIDYYWPDPVKLLDFEKPVGVQLSGEAGSYVVTWTLNGETYTEAENVDDTGCAHVYVAPIYDKYHFVNFHLGPRNGELTHQLLTRKVIVLGDGGETLVRIGNLTAPTIDAKHLVFVGWETVNGSERDHFFYTREKDGEEINKTADADGDEYPNPEGRTGYYITATGNTDLYPVFAEAHWFYFSTGKGGNGATYVPAEYVLTCDDYPNTAGLSESYYLEKLPVSERTGFNFMGWYTNTHLDADGNLVDLAQAQKVADETGQLVGNRVFTDANGRKTFEINDGKLYAYRAEDDDTLYALWEEVPDTEYTVIVWRQKVTDDKNALTPGEFEAWKAQQDSSLSDDALLALAREEGVYPLKTYDFEKAEVLKGRSGTTLDQLLEGAVKPYTQYTGYVAADDTDYTGFRYSYAAMSAPALAGDRSTVVNVYYDRELVTIDFIVYGRYGVAASISGNTTYYGLVDGSYVALTRSGSAPNYTWSYSYARYVQITDASDTSGDQYGYYNGGYVPIYYRNGAWYRNNYSSSRYTGNRYRREVVEVEYTGQVYQYYSSNAFRAFDTFTGLYGQTLSQNNYIWPTVYDWYNSYTSSYSGYSGSGTRTTFLAAFLPTDDEVEHVTYYGFSPTTGGTVIFYQQDILTDGTPAASYTEVNRVAVKSNSSFNITDKYNGFAADTYRTNNGIWMSVGTKPEGSNVYGNPVSFTGTLEIRFKRIIYDLTFDVNYPTYAGITFSAGQSEDKTESVAYEASLQKFGPLGSAYFAPIVPDNYTFEGWYEDATGTVPFNFNSTMPAANKVVYAKWEPVKFRVMIDPNGAVIDHINYNGETYGFRTDNSGYNPNEATYFNATYNETVGAYTLSRLYTEITEAEAQELGEDKVYYYINTQYDRNYDGDGLPTNLRNAMYVKEGELRSYYNYYSGLLASEKASNPERYGNITVLGFENWKAHYVSGQKYRALRSGESYKFLGWYCEDGDSSGSNMPYNFEDKVKGPMLLRAHWRFDGGYTILYSPEYIMPDGTIINGEMEKWTDPAENDVITAEQVTYADQAKTKIYSQPTGITANGTATEDYVFRGWQLVYRSEAIGSTEPIEPGVYYDPSDDFVIQAKFADEQGIIHMQAVYELKSSAYKRPGVANLTLDANRQFYGDSASVTNEGVWPEWEYAGSSFLDTENDQILFGDIQSNAAVHLYRYATDLTKDVNGKTLVPAGTNFFRYEDNFLLLGFDDAAAEGDYIATYPADAVIAVQRTDRKTLYAVWEPMVYINFYNQTDVGDVTFGISAGEANTLYIVNEKHGVYDRVAVEDVSNIVVKQGETLRLAVPRASGKTITISGTNTLGAGYDLLWDITMDGQPHGTPNSGSQSNGKDFSFSTQLVVDPVGVDVTFSHQKRDRTLVLDDNYAGGSKSEVYFELEASHYSLPLTSTRFGYVFRGWATESSATSADYGTGTAQTSIDDLDAFFGEETVKTLYAVWEARMDANTVYVYKTVPAPGSQDKPFTFTVGFAGTYDYNNSRYNDDSFTEMGSFELKSGEYLVIESSKESQQSSRYAFVNAIVTVYDVDGNEDAGRSKTISWTSKYASAGTFQSDFSMYVRENDYSGEHYDTSVEILASTRPAGSNAEDDLKPNDNGREVNWLNTDPGGSIMFTNTRQTSDVTLKKVLEPDGEKFFKFSATIEDGDGNILPLNDIHISSRNESGYTFRDVPVGAKLTLREVLGDGDSSNYDTTVSLGEGTPEACDANNGYVLTVPEIDTTVTFTNKLRSQRIEFHKVDDAGNAVEAQFRLDGVDRILFAGGDTGTLFYSGEMFVGTYMLREDWVQPGYLGLNRPLRVEVKHDEVAVTATDAADADNIRSVVQNDDGTWVVTIVNHKTVNLIIAETFVDELLPARTFYYRVVIDGGAATYYAVAANSEKVISVPVGAKVEITQLMGVTLGEDTVETPLDTTLYDTTTVAVATDPEDVIEDGDQSEACFQIASMPNSAGTVTFTNTRKRVSVKLIKVGVHVQGAPEFSFTAQVKTPAGQAIDVQGVTDADIKLTAREERMLANIPIGATLVITEARNMEYRTEATSNAENGVYQNAERSYTIANIGEGVVVTFTNTFTIPPPTGVAARGLPYAILLAFGSMLIGLTLWKKKKRKGGGAI